MKTNSTSSPSWVVTTQRSSQRWDTKAAQQWSAKFLWKDFPCGLPALYRRLAHHLLRKLGCWRRRRATNDKEEYIDYILFVLYIWYAIRLVYSNINDTSIKTFQLCTVNNSAPVHVTSNRREANIESAKGEAPSFRIFLQILSAL